MLGLAASGNIGVRYHGWKVVAALFVVGMVVYGCGLYSFTLFITPLTREFGWSRAATSGLVSVYWLAAPMTLFGEPLVRRIGGVRLIVIGVVVAAASTLALGFCSTLPTLFVLRFLMGAGKVLMASGVTLLAAHWFRARFGLALACCYAGWHCGGLVMVPLTQLLIDSIGWRETTTVMAIAIITIPLPLLLLWVRAPSPADPGFAQEMAPRPTDRQRPADAQPASGLSTVLTRPVLWLSIGFTTIGGLAYGTVLTHEATLVDEIGPLHGIGAAAVSATAFAALVGAIVMGWLADRMAFRRLILLELGLMLAGILGFLCIYALAWPVVALFAATSFGIAVGGFEAAILPHMRRHLSTADFDHAFGIWYLCYLLTLFAAPIAAGRFYDLGGSYAPVLALLAVTTAIAAIPAFCMPGVSPRTRRTS